MPLWFREATQPPSAATVERKVQRTRREGEARGVPGFHPPCELSVSAGLNIRNLASIIAKLRGTGVDDGDRRRYDMDSVTLCPANVNVKRTFWV